MAGKQLGRLRQWAGEKISLRDKSVVGDEMKELEQDIELRKQGILRLQAASQAYHRALSKKKVYPASGEATKLMPLDALGIVMASHGEEFGIDSPLGTSLVKLGKAHCQIATLQEAYTLTLGDTFLASCERLLQGIKDYEHQRKKLEGRRSSYDAAISRLEKIKNGKKDREKERREAEAELQRSRLQFEETSEDVRVRLCTVQESEHRQLRDLTAFLDAHLNFAKQCVEVLGDVKAEWVDTATLSSFEHVKTSLQPSMNEYPTMGSMRSTTSALPSSEEDSVNGSQKSSSRKQSRPASRASRKREDSSGGEGTGGKSSMRLSVAGWASSAVSSIAGRGKRDKESFTTLTDEEEERDQRQSLSRRTVSSLRQGESLMLQSGNDITELREDGEISELDGSEMDDEMRYEWSGRPMDVQTVGNPMGIRSTADEDQRPIPGCSGVSKKVPPPPPPPRRCTPAFPSRPLIPERPPAIGRMSSRASGHGPGVSPFDSLERLSERVDTIVS